MTMAAHLADLRESECTGVAAGWCPVCGDCTCPHEDDGSPVERIVPAVEPSEQVAHVVLNGIGAHEHIEVVHDPACPLHGVESHHAEMLR